MQPDRALIRQATTQLLEAGIQSAEHDATVLLEHASTTQEFHELVAKRAQRIPLQHLTRIAYFRYLSLAVGSGVFVPRPETELLAQVGIDVLGEIVRQQTHSIAQTTTDVKQRIISELENHEVLTENADAVHRPKPIAFDLCAGSGAVALSLATEVSNVTVHAVEQSVEATSWLMENVSRYEQQLESNNSRITVHTLDATDLNQFTQWFNTADVVLSNPPYIPNDMIPREPEVRDHDPQVALFGGTVGLEIPQAVAFVAAHLLQDGGTFAMEHADVQGEGDSGLPAVLRNMRDTSGALVWQNVMDHTDYNGLPRFTTAIRAQRPIEVKQ